MKTNEFQISLIQHVSQTNTPLSLAVGRAPTQNGAFRLGFGNHDWASEKKMSELKLLRIASLAIKPPASCYSEYRVGAEAPVGGSDGPLPPEP